MNTRYPTTFKKAEDEICRVIKGLKSLKIVKIKETISLYFPGEKFNTGVQILQSFQTKKE
jgi:hypothetical protein